MILRDFVDQDVVDETAVLVQQSRVVGLPFLQAGCIVGRDEVHEAFCFGTANFNLSHVAHVENADGVSNGVMFFEYAGILYGHVPAPEVHHARAHAPMDRVEWCQLQRGRERCHGFFTRALPTVHSSRQASTARYLNSMETRYSVCALDCPDACS